MSVAGAGEAIASALENTKKLDKDDKENGLPRRPTNDQNDDKKLLFKSSPVNTDSSGKQASPSGSTASPANSSQSQQDDRKLQFMKLMAKLKLEAEISQLESSCRNDDSQLSPYLIPDTSALCFNLKMVQDLAKMSKFILIVPLVVIDQLDEMKKESKQAREAIRWLEGQFRQGNRFLRAQSCDEKLVNRSGGLQLKKSDQLLDCCHFFHKDWTSKNASDKRSNVVTLLTGNEQPSLFNASQLKTIEVANIREFFKRLRKD